MGGELTCDGESDDSRADYLVLLVVFTGCAGAGGTAWVTSAPGARVEEKLRCGERRRGRLSRLVRITMAWAILT